MLWTRPGDAQQQVCVCVSDGEQNASSSSYAANSNGNRADVAGASMLDLQGHTHAYEESPSLSCFGRSPNGWSRWMVMMATGFCG